MSLERELKFAVADLAHVRRRLVEFGAEALGPPSHEANLVFDRDAELRRAGCLLRLRTDDRGVRLTFKGPAKWSGTVKVRQEHEVVVSEAQGLRQLLEALGYEVVKRYEKVRQEWRLGETLVALDRTPMGEFVEFEGPQAESAAVRAGFAPEDAELRNYLELYDDYREAHPETPPDMLFAGRDRLTLP